MKSAEQIQFEAFMAAPQESAAIDGAVLNLHMTREAAEKLKGELEGKVSGLLDRILTAQHRRRWKKARSLYREACEVQAAVDFLTRTLEIGFAAGEEEG